MQLKEYQKKAVDQLLEIVKILIPKTGTRLCVFKAPTGSGKTIMAADFLQQLISENLSTKLSFIWVSAHNLHQQSRAKLENYLRDTQIKFSYLEDIQDKTIKENEILFINWEEITKKDRETGEFTNVFMRDNEQERNLPTFVKNTKEEGREVILIVDESHYYYWSQDSQRLINEKINPNVILEISATPKIEPKPEDLVNKDAGFVSIKFEDVVAEGMIKKEIIINEEFENLKITDQTADEVVIEAALKKREQLKKLYQSQSSPVNPLVLIQLPSQSQATSSLDRAKIEIIKQILKDKHGITTENKKLAIWLSDEKDNLEDIELIDNETEVLIFKQAIAIGWDCPRAQILIMFRETQSVIFEIQTVGRIIRMPEIKHYDNESLNKAYIFTNLSQINIKAGLDQGYFYRYLARAKEGFKKVNLHSVYLQRADYGDLTFSFRKVLMNELNSYFGIDQSDMVNVIVKKIEEKGVALSNKKLTESVMSDGKITDVDMVHDSVIGSGYLELNQSSEDIKEAFDNFTKAKSLPYAPIRSYTKIQQALYDWFDKYVGYKGKSRLEVQKIVLLPKNIEIFDQIIERAKFKYQPVKNQEAEARKIERTNNAWNPPALLYYSDLYATYDYPSHVLQPAYMLRDQSQVEADFERKLKESDKVEWWFKNGQNSDEFLGIKYFNSTGQKDYVFYPDYIVLFKDGRIGIYETKDGETASLFDTVDKAKALFDYMSKNKDKKLCGGIVVRNSRGWFVHNGKDYNFDVNLKGWGELVF